MFMNLSDCLPTNNLVYAATIPTRWFVDPAFLPWVVPAADAGMRFRMSAAIAHRSFVEGKRTGPSCCQYHDWTYRLRERRDYVIN
jgi:hypothetical protein